VSERVMRIPLSELNQVRIVCCGQYLGRPCGAILEMPLSQVADLHSHMPQCPFCRTPFDLRPSGMVGVTQDVFRPFADAVTNLLAAEMQQGTQQPRFRVEFVLTEGVPNS
jgi:hypothetical protein